MTRLEISQPSAPPPIPHDEPEQLPLFSQPALDAVREEKAKWQAASSKKPAWKKDFTTVSGMEVNPLATPENVANLDFDRDLTFPGQFPYTRGIHPGGYRGRLWTMRQFAGFGSATQTNERFKYMLAHGQTGLSTAFHLPTLYGYDSDHHFSAGEVGKCGVAVDTLADMETLFDGIDLEDITVSMTINSTGPIALAMYLVVAEKQGADWKKISGTLQNDILKEYIAQKEYIFPPRPSMRLITDTFKFCAENVPKYNPISISGYHIREAGSTAVQEVAFTLADGIAYVEAAVSAGLQVDDFAPRLSFFFNAHNDFLEEIAKFRAARRLWARTMRVRFGARDPRSTMLRFHAQTAGSTLTAQQPDVNVVRVALQAMAAVLGGAQSLHTNSRDEALGLPAPEAARLALRTQQVIAYESGVTAVPDPLGGSEYIENLTDDIECGAAAYIARIDKMGGTLRAIEEGYIQREIQNAAFEYQKKVETGETVVVGVNRFEETATASPAVFKVNPAIEQRQVDRVRELRASRDPHAHVARLDELENAARGSANLMPHILASCEAKATVGEISDRLRKVFGEYKEG